MKIIIRKVVLFTALLAILTSAVLCTISAAGASMPQSMLALGDSLTTGYALPDYVDENDPYACKSYANLIAAAMGLQGGDTYINRAVNGDTSSNLASRLPGMKGDVQKAELIVISIGGNDMDRLIPLILYKVTGKQITEYSQMAAALQGVAPEAYASLENDAEVQGAIADAVAKLKDNLKTVSDMIKENAPDARVIFLQQYNPLHVQGFSDFAAFSQKSLDAANAAIAENAQSYGFEVLDVPSIINSRAAELTNIQKFDIHPNEQGHLEIAKLLAAHLGISLDPAENTTAETTAAPEETTEQATVTTDVPESEAPTQTDAATESATQPTAPAQNSGCQSAVLGASLLSLLLCAAIVLKKSK
ncbi:MAG: SGNH/GDSL hydrolase family protein [Clostridia bacterium]|nr:SGNH/GDSL hydrolase family protein [Clostridia bacterium]